MFCFCAFHFIARSRSKLFTIYWMCIGIVNWFLRQHVNLILKALNGMGNVVVLCSDWICVGFSRLVFALLVSFFFYFLWWLVWSWRKFVENQLKKFTIIAIIVTAMYVCVFKDHFGHQTFFGVDQLKCYLLR